MNYNRLFFNLSKFKYFLFLPIILYSIFIVYLSSLSAIPYIITNFEIKDKILHFIGFTGYGVLLFLPIFFLNQNFNEPLDINSIYSNLKKSYIYTFIIAFIFAISDEIHQSYVPGRDADIWDLVADTMGIFFSLLIYHFILKLLLPKLK